MRVAVFNAQYQFINFTTWRSAINLVLLDKAVLLEETEIIKRIGTVTKEFIITAAIKLKYYVRPRRPKNEVRWTKYNVLRRDNWICAYCGIGDGEYNERGKMLTKRDFTVDHVKPKSQGGGDSFKNTVCACSPCNRFKADRTPAQAGMKLLWKPHSPKLIQNQDVYTQLIAGRL